MRCFFLRQRGAFPDIRRTHLKTSDFLYLTALLLFKKTATHVSPANKSYKKDSSSSIMMDNKPKNKKRTFDASKKKEAIGKKNIPPIKPKEKRKDKRNRPHPDEDMPASERPIKSKNSKIIFDDEGNTVAPSKAKAKSSNKSAYNNDSDVATKWYNEVFVGSVH